MICSKIEKISTRFIIVVTISLFCSIGCQDRSANGERPPNLYSESVDIGAFEDRIVNLENKLKWVSETQELYLVFNNYRIGLVGIIITSIGLIAVVLTVFVYVKGASHLIAIREEKVKAETALDDISEAKKGILANIKDTEEQLTKIFDNVILQMGQLSEIKTETIDILDNYKQKHKTYKDIVSILIEMQKKERKAFYCIYYQVALFHPDKARVEKAILYFRKMGTLEDISKLEQMLDQNKFPNLKNKVRMAIIEIRNRAEKMNG